MNAIHAERLARQLHLVRSGDPDLTQRQLAMLMVAAWTEGDHTVRSMAAWLGVQKPVITRAANRLSELGFIRRDRDPNDGRNIFLRATDSGRAFVERFGREGGSVQ